jgi:hypothetical protein
MSRLHVFIDGSWLFKACAPEKALALRLEYPERSFRLNFGRLCQALLGHVSTNDPRCDSIGDRYLSTSIFSIPDDVDEWPAERDDITSADIENVRHSVAARDAFAKGAVDAGFDPSAIYRPHLKGWMIQKLRERRFQEKQVDATVVALLVRSAITNSGDYHAIITGDADVLPAIKVAYPKYSENVFVATTHPDQLQAESRQTSFALADFDYRIPPYFLDENVKSFVEGANVYVCGHCNKVFARPNPIPAGRRPCCSPCHKTRT